MRCITKVNDSKEVFMNSFEKRKQKRAKIEKLALAAVLTALVFVLQMLGQFIKLGPFSISLVLIPIVIGAATLGPSIGAWLGLVFGVTVFISGDAAAFLAVNIPGTIITVLVKGILCGYLAGVSYKLLEKKNKIAATVVAAIVCPVVNTGVFFIGCILFFMDTVAQWAAGFGLEGQVIKYMFLGLAGGNFLFEFGTNLILSPVIIRFLNIIKKK